MQSKTSALLLTGMILLLVFIPVSAYDYQGVPRPGETNVSNSLSESLGSLSSGSLDSSQISSVVATIITLIMYFILQLLGIPTS